MEIPSFLNPFNWFGRNSDSSNSPGLRLSEEVAPSRDIFTAYKWGQGQDSLGRSYLTPNFETTTFEAALAAYTKVVEVLSDTSMTSALAATEGGQARLEYLRTQGESAKATIESFKSYQKQITTLTSNLFNAAALPQGVSLPGPSFAA